MIIKRAIKLWESLEDYNIKMLKWTDPADENIQLDKLSSDDWEMLTKIKTTLKPFYEVIKQLEENATEESHGALWEVVVGLEYLI